MPKFYERLDENGFITQRFLNYPDRRLQSPADRHPAEKRQRRFIMMVIKEMESYGPTGHEMVVFAQDKKRA